MNNVVMKAALKKLLNLCCLVAAAPFSLMSRLENRIAPSSEVVFSFCAQCMPFLPVLPGVYIRRAYYHQSVDNCSPFSTIGFGILLTQGNVRGNERTYVGNYAVIRSFGVGKDCEVGSRVSVPCGKQQHNITGNGTWATLLKVPFRRLQL